MTTVRKKDAKLHLLSGKGDFRNHYAVIRYTTAAIFHPGPKGTFESLVAFDPTRNQDNYERYLENLNDKWKPVQVDPELMNRFFIPMAHFFLFQKEFEYLGFTLPMPRVIWNNERIPT